MRDFFRWFLAPFLVGFILGREALGQERGLDLLAVQHERFPVARFARRIPGGFVGGNLDNTFGRRLAPIRRFLKTGRVGAWRTHFFNGPCLRGGNCAPNEPHHGRTVNGFALAWENGGRGKLRHHLIQRVRVYCALFEEFPAVQWYASGTLEHQLTHRGVRQQARLIRRHCPNAVVVDSPVKGVPGTPGLVPERHGRELSLKPPCIVSLDGEVGGVSQRRFFAAHPQCIALGWSPPLNCRKPDGPFEPPLTRTSCPTAAEVNRLLSAL